MILFLAGMNDKMIIFFSTLPHLMNKRAVRNVKYSLMQNVQKI